jgi:glycosyltransferase involved in cell wall biosynthesis
MNLLIVSTFSPAHGGGGEWDALSRAERVLLRGGSVRWLSERRGGGAASVPEFFSYRALDGEAPGAELEAELETEMRAACVPTLVYTYGEISIHAVRAARRAGLPCVVGVHFWTSLVRLGCVPTDVLGNASRHSALPHALELLDGATQVVACSEYVVRCVQKIVGRTICRVQPSLPHPSSLSHRSYIPQERRYVLFGSVHPLKGGEIALYLARSFPEIPLLCLCPEPDSDKMADHLRSFKQVVVQRYAKKMSSAFAMARIAVAGSVIDETFGRFAFESCCNGVPLSTSLCGNLAAVAPPGGCVWADPAHPGDAAECIARLYSGPPSRLSAMSAAALEFAAKYTRANADPDVDWFDFAPAHVAIVVPFADTGLGKQGKAYSLALQRLGIRDCIFSYCTYEREARMWFEKRDQRDIAEYAHPRVYYSQNTRENVTEEEIASFVRTYDVRVAIVPELCFGALNVLSHFRAAGARTISVPNVELMRADDVPRADAVVDEFAANNEQALACLRASFTKPVSLLSFPVLMHCDTPRIPSTDTISMLLCCGRVGQIRKRAETITATFATHFQRNPLSRLRLLVTSQSARNLGPVRPCPFTTVYDRPMTNAELAALRASTDIVIILSNEEGLGMEFFEAMEAGCLILTHDGEPHREFAFHPLLLCKAHRPDMDPRINPSPLIRSNQVDEQSLLAAFDALSRVPRPFLEQLRSQSIALYRARFSHTHFDSRLRTLLSRHLPAPPASPAP